jgi:hypothetical protein
MGKREQSGTQEIRKFINEAIHSNTTRLIVRDTMAKLNIGSLSTLMAFI